MNENIALGGYISAGCIFLVCLWGGWVLGLLAFLACCGTFILCVGLETSLTTRRSGEGA